MTRKDFELIAAALAASKIGDRTMSDYDKGYEYARAVLADRLASALATTNPLFKRERFLDACDIEAPR